MQLAIDRFRNSSGTSSKRSYLWLYDKLVEAIEIHQLEENTASIEKSLANIASSSKDANAAPSKPIKEKQKDDQNKNKQKDTKDSKPDKPDKNKREPKNKSEKQSKAAQPSDVQAAVAKGKSSGKGDKRDEKSPEGKKVKEGDKKKLPCMYYACNSCNKGNECPYFHDSKNLYKPRDPRSNLAPVKM